MRVFGFCSVEGCTWQVGPTAVGDADEVAQAAVEHHRAHLDDSRPLAVVISASPMKHVTVDEPESAEPPEDPSPAVGVDWTRRRRRRPR